MVCLVNWINSLYPTCMRDWAGICFLFVRWTNCIDFFSQDFQQKKSSWAEKSQICETCGFLHKNVELLHIFFLFFLVNCSLQNWVDFHPTQPISFNCSVDRMNWFFGDLWTSNRQVRQRWKVGCAPSVVIGVNPFAAFIYVWIAAFPRSCPSFSEIGCSKTGRIAICNNSSLPLLPIICLSSFSPTTHPYVLIFIPSLSLYLQLHISS